MANMIEVNLLPIEYRVVRKDYSYLADRRVIWSTLALLVVLVVAWLHFMTLVATIAAKQANIANLREEIATYDTVKTQIDQYQALKDKQEAKNKALQSISVSKKRWVRILEDINASLPSHTWLVSVKEEEGANDRLKIVARTYVFQEVAGFMLQLERRPYFLAPSLEAIEQTKGDKDSPGAFAFTLHCPLDPAIHEDGAPGSGSDSARVAGGASDVRH